jgi:hypothetical protein
MDRNKPHMPTWMSQGDLNLGGKLHDLPKHPKIILPKFDPEKSCAPEDYIKKLYLVVRLMNVKHEDAVYRLFRYTFANKTFAWYYNLLTCSITGWDDFQKEFINRFGC